MHGVDERVEVNDIAGLALIYTALIEGYFATFAG
jgi:acetylornithine deacetylase/succinyl-diaminopimelate desuccinylase-like protein